MTPWAPVVIKLAPAVLPGDNGVLIIDSKSMREHLGIDAMSSLRHTVLNRSSDETYILSADQVVQAALDGRNADIEEQRTVQVGQVAVAS